jgi:hypothetical protein
MHTSGSRLGPLASYCEHGKEHSGSVKGEEFLGQFDHY